MNDHISGFIFMVLKSRNVFQMSILKKLSIVLHSVHVNVHINRKLSYR